MKKFTVFILDVTRDTADPLVLPIEAVDALSIRAAAAAAFYEHVKESELECGLCYGGDLAGHAWASLGAAIIGILPGHAYVVWNPEDCGYDEFKSAWELPQ